MQKLFDISVVNTLKDGINKGWWTLIYLSQPPPGWIECINNTKGNKAFPNGYQGVEYQILARVKILKPKPKEEKVELTDPKDLPTEYNF